MAPMHVRNIAPHPVNGPDGSWLLPAQSAHWDDEEYATEMVAALLVVDLNDEQPTPDPGSGPSPAPEPAPEPSPDPTEGPEPVPAEPSSEATPKRSRKR